MSTRPFYRSPAGQALPYIVDKDENSNFYDGSSEGSSTASLVNGNTSGNFSLSNAHRSSQSFSGGFPMHVLYHESGAIPIELEIENLYQDFDRQKKRDSISKKVSSQVHLRRRAQNRASQRAFRERKERHVKEVEKRLQELEGKYTDLSQSYEVLQNEYAMVKQELHRLVKEDERYGRRSTDKNSEKLYYSGNSYVVPHHAEPGSGMFVESAFGFEPGLPGGASEDGSETSDWQ